MGTRALAEDLGVRIRLAAAKGGLPAPKVVTEPSDVVAPCLLIGPPNYTFDTDGSPRLTWSIVALAPPPVTAGTWDELESLIDAVDWAVPIVTATAGALALPGVSVDPLPCYTITYEEHR